MSNDERLKSALQLLTNILETTVFFAKILIFKANRTFYRENTVLET